MIPIVPSRPFCSYFNQLRLELLALQLGFNRTAKTFRPVRFNLHLSMHFIEPEALAEPRRRKSASDSGSVSSQLISIVQVETFSPKILDSYDRLLYYHANTAKQWLVETQVY